MKSAYSTNGLNRNRSAIDPVGIVAAVSMNTSWNRKKAMTPTS